MKRAFFAFCAIVLLIFFVGAAMQPVSAFAQPDTGANEEANIQGLRAIIVQLLSLIVELQQRLLATLEAQAPVGVGCGQTEIEWEKVSGAKEYVLYRDGVEVYSGKDMKFTDTGLIPGAQYAYTVRARNSGGLGAASKAKTITITNACPPATPTVWGQAGVCGGSTQVFWSRTQGASLYEVFRGKTRVFGGATLSFVDRGLSKEREYTYKVRAGNSGGVGGFSEEVKIKSSAVCPPEAPEAPSVGGPFLDENVAQEGILTLEIKGSPSGAKIRSERSGNVLSFTVKAQLSPIFIERVDVEFSDRAWLFLSDITIRDGSRTVASKKAEESAFTRVGDKTWRMVFSGLAIQVKEGRSNTISVQVTAKENKNLIDSREMDVSIPAGSVRGRDEIGVTHFGPALNTFVKPFSVEKE